MCKQLSSQSIGDFCSYMGIFPQPIHLVRYQSCYFLLHAVTIQTQSSTSWVLGIYGLSEDFINGTDRHTNRWIDCFPELLSELKIINNVQCKSIISNLSSSCNTLINIILMVNACLGYSLSYAFSFYALSYVLSSL